MNEQSNPLLVPHFKALLAEYDKLKADNAQLRQQLEDVEDPKCEFCPNRGAIQICTHCWNGANNDTWQRKAVKAEAEIARLHLMIEMMNNGA